MGHFNWTSLSAILVNWSYSVLETSRERSTATGAAICHRAQAFNLSRHWEEAAKPLACTAQQVTGEIRGAAQQTNTGCIVFSGILLSWCYLLLHLLNWYKTIYSTQVKPAAKGYSEYFVKAAAPSISFIYHTTLLHEDPEISLLLTICLSAADFIVLVGWNMIYSILSLQLTPSTSLLWWFIRKMGKDGHLKAKGQAKHSPALTFALAIFHANISMKNATGWVGCILQL